MQTTVHKFLQIFQELSMHGPQEGLISFTSPKTTYTIFPSYLYFFLHCLTKAFEAAQHICLPQMRSLKALVWNSLAGRIDTISCTGLVLTISARKSKDSANQIFCIQEGPLAVRSIAATFVLELHVIVWELFLVTKGSGLVPIISPVAESCFYISFHCRRSTISLDNSEARWVLTVDFVLCHLQTKVCIVVGGPKWIQWLCCQNIGLFINWLWWTNDDSKLYKKALHA